MSNRRAIVVVRGHPNFGHQHSWGGAFAAGLKRHGWIVDVSGNYRPADMVVFWGVRRAEEMAQQKQAGAEICVLERGYLGDRFGWTSVSFGGELNGNAEFRGVRDEPSRFRDNFAPLMKEWRHPSKGHVLLLGQVYGDASLRHVDIEAFYRRAIAAFHKQGYEVRFRPHPLARNGEKPKHSLEQDLAGARFAVTWNSNSGVDAVLAGVPCVTMDKGAMAWPVTGHTLELPPAPEREAWAHRLAWCQWRMDEMESGACWEAVGRELVAA